MRTCSQCGGRLKRVHRTFLERFSYMAIYQCRRCSREESIPRRFRHHFGKECRCPRCGTYRVSRLKARDKIDPMQTGFLNFLERLAGGTLHYCCFCRLQFYDRRPMAPRSAVQPGAEPDDVTKQDTATSGA